MGGGFRVVGIPARISSLTREFPKLGYSTLLVGSLVQGPRSEVPRIFGISSLVAICPLLGLFGLFLGLFLRGFFSWSFLTWVLVTELNLSYHNKEAPVFTLDPYHGNLNPRP